VRLSQGRLVTRGKGAVVLCRRGSVALDGIEKV